jgi:hypothetical protein
LRAPYTRTHTSAPFFFGRPKSGQATSRKQQQPERSCEGDQKRPAENLKALGSPTPQIGSIDMHFQAKSSKIAEELTATAPLQFGR